MSEVPQAAWNHFLLVVSLYASWTIAVAYMGAKNILWDYSEEEPAA